MPTRTQWRDLVSAMVPNRPAPVSAATYLEKIGSASAPVKAICADNNVYLIKGRQNGRMIVNEQVVGVLGEKLNAPVAAVRFVDVPQALIDAQPEMSHMPAGVSHGSLWEDDCTDRQGIVYTDVDENKPRFASLAVLYSLVGANDHQWIYRKVAPNLVYSVDHGHFFNGGPNWTSASLAAAPPPALDGNFASCGLAPADYDAARQGLRDLTHEDIADACARPWHDWLITDDERIDLAEFFDARRTDLLALI